jgi:hypothetical protein
MPEVTIAVGVFRWTTPAGKRALASYGQQIELENETVDRYKHLGVFEVIRRSSSEEDRPSPTGANEPEEPAGLPIGNTSEPPDKPAYAATKGVWVEYADALHRHTQGRAGLREADAEQLNRRELINALAGTEAAAPQQNPDAQISQTPTPTATELAQETLPPESKSFEDDNIERTRQ